MQNRSSIIVIDDSRLILRILSNILSPFYNVHCFDRVDKAIETIEALKPSLILADIIMPQISGFDMVEWLKANYTTKDIPVILMTSKDEDGENEERSFMLGAVDFIPKPFRPPVVLARVRTHVQLYEYQKELEKTTVTDALTSIYNRRGFDNIYHREWGRSVREGLPLSLCMVDIDYFKKYNDHYGHQAGDNALHMVAQAIKGSLHRSTDVSARYGGEEFAVILPNVDAGGAAAVADHLNQAVRGLEIKHEYSSASDKMTVSIGVATALAIPSKNILVEAADNMLYKAKKNGRNCFCQTVIEE